MAFNDISQQLQQQLQQAFVDKRGVSVVAGGTKQFYGRDPGITYEALDVSDHKGVVSYEPTELVVTARAGTTVSELNQVLAEHGQRLPFEPPVFNGEATLSGPSRPYTGAARDFVLGTNIINGRAQLLRFGGEVIKNVAGYDVSRLMVGAMGTLGVILQASLKVLPIPQKETTIIFHLERDSALDLMNDFAARPLPVSATCFYGDILFVRLSGSEAAVESAYMALGGERLPKTDEVWQSLREFQHPFFDTELPLWRIAMTTAARPELPGEVMIEWGGAQWWLHSDSPAEEIRLAAARCGGHATLFRGGDRSSEIFHPLPPKMAALQERIRLAFDPHGILNPGRIEALNKKQS